MFVLFLIILITRIYIAIKGPYAKSPWSEAGSFAFFLGLAAAIVIPLLQNEKITLLSLLVSFGTSSIVTTIIWLFSAIFMVIGALKANTLVQMAQIEATQEITNTITEKFADAQGSNSSTIVEAHNLVKRGLMFLEDENWQRAYETFDKALDLNPENSYAYIGLIFARANVSTDEELKESGYNYWDQPEWKRAYKFADEKLKEKLDKMTNESILKVEQVSGVSESEYVDEVPKIESQREDEQATVVSEAEQVINVPRIEVERESEQTAGIPEPEQVGNVPKIELGSTPVRRRR